MTESYGNWTLEAAVAITHTTEYQIAQATGNCKATAGFLAELHAQIASYGINSEQLVTLKARFELLVKHLERAQADAQQLTQALRDFTGGFDERA